MNLNNLTNCVIYLRSQIILLADHWRRSSRSVELQTVWSRSRLRHEDARLPIFDYQPARRVENVLAAAIP